MKNFLHLDEKPEMCKCFEHLIILTECCDAINHMGGGDADQSVTELKIQENKIIK